MLGLCIIPVGIGLYVQKPSESCGPFAGKESPYDAMGEGFHGLPIKVVEYCNILMSPVIIVPIIVFLFLYIYYSAFKNFGPAPKL